MVSHECGNGGVRVKCQSSFSTLALDSDPKKKESACKPGSVRGEPRGNHSSGASVTADLVRPTRKHRGPRYCFPIWSCSEWGLPSHSVLPPARCALTAPFHPYLACYSRAVYFLLHFPWTHVPQALPGTLPCGARTFLPAFGRNLGEAITRPTPGSIIAETDTAW